MRRRSRATAPAARAAAPAARPPRLRGARARRTRRARFARREGAGGARASGGQGRTVGASEPGLGAFLGLACSAAEQARARRKRRVDAHGTVARRPPCVRSVLRSWPTRG
jgi:hypothetical protein